MSTNSGPRVWPWIFAGLTALLMLLAAGTAAVVLTFGSVGDELTGAGEQPAPSTLPSEVPPETSAAEPTTAEPTTDATEPAADFSTVYADVASGVGEIAADTCEGSYSGTGFLVGPRTIMTAAHVVEDATSISVELDDGGVPASVVGVDSIHDLALLALDGRSSGHVFTFAAADPQPGTRVAAIGFPLGAPKTLTEGTVSGLNREVTTETATFGGLLQTDVALNPGNSGGPLVALTGDVVGVADAVRLDAAGIGFAVPASTAAPVDEGQAAVSAPEVPWCVESIDPVEAGMTRTIHAYLRAINLDDYDTAMRQLTPQFRAEFSDRSEWLAGIATSYDDRLTVHTVYGSQAFATFRSRQASGDGPADDPYATCVIWSIDYTFEQQGTRWLIADVEGRGDPPYTFC